MLVRTNVSIVGLKGLQLVRPEVHSGSLNQSSNGTLRQHCLNIIKVLAMHVLRGRAPSGSHCNPCAATQPLQVAYVSTAWRRLAAHAGLEQFERISARGNVVASAFRPANNPANSSSNMTAIIGADGKASSLRKLVVDGVDDSAMVQVKFCLKYRTSYGQSVKIIGSHPKLGSWDINKALNLDWTDGDRWIAAVELPAGAVYEYKYVLVDHDSRATLAWQGGGNSVLALGDQDGQGVEVQDNWGNNPGQAAVVVNGVSTTRESKLQAWANEMRQYRAMARNAQYELSRKAEELQASKAQVARLKMELSVSLKAREDLEARLAEVESENLALRAQVAQSQIAMKSTLEEAIKLLQQEIEEGEEELYNEEEEEVYVPAAGGNGKTATSNGASPWSWGRGKEAETVYAGSNGNGSTFERFGFRLSGNPFDMQGEQAATRPSTERASDLGAARVATTSSGSGSSYTGSGHVLADWRTRLSNGGQ